MNKSKTKDILKDLDEPSKISKQPTDTSSKKKTNKNTDNSEHAQGKFMGNNDKDDSIIFKDKEKNKSVISTRSDIDVKTNHNEEIEKKNAFAFMMDSRSKSIGQNSPGKDLEQAEECYEARNERRKKLSDRKDMFKAWAERKGGKKREIEDAERGVIIEKKLEERSKRLKKMLKVQKL